MATLGSSLYNIQPNKTDSIIKVENSARKICRFEKHFVLNRGNLVLFNKYHMLIQQQHIV